MLSFLYTVIIYPIQLILECCYVLILSIIDDLPGAEGLATISLSVIVTLFTIPLYMIAEKWSEKERQLQNKMAPQLARIKKTFTGDERYMMQNTFYRQNHYHPIMALRSSFSIFIQVPFFIAAYNFLDNLEILRGIPFFFVKNLGEADATFTIGSFPINVLPIAMTLINCVSGYVYSKDHRLSEKLQIYGCALLFLVILYNSPSGLVIYWTMNNVLSLVKNIFYKIKNPKKVLYICCCVFAGMLVLGNFTFLSSTKNIYRLAVLLLALVLVGIPYLIKAFDFCISKRFMFLEEDSFLRLSIFLLSVIGITLLAGLVIPSILIQSEPEQFSYIEDFASPFVFLRAPFFQAIGLFLFWPSCFYALFSKRTKKNMAVIFGFLFFLATVNCFLFSGNYGPIDASLFFAQTQYFTTIKFTLTSIGAIIALVFMYNLILHRKARILSGFSVILIISFVAISAKNCFSINASFKNMEPPVSKSKIEPVYHLSSTGKNVIVVMQDALISYALPIIFEERPDLKTRFDGFKYYPNATSMNSCTMFGSPGLFGGYDYTPFYMNQRTDKTLQQKHNEALLTMPVLFSEAGWKVTVSDLPYENFLEEPVGKMYDGYPNIDHPAVQGSISNIWYEKNNFEKNNYVSFSCMRNFLMFSIFKMISPFLRLVVYGHEYWVSTDEAYDESYFVGNYSQLDMLDELFDLTSEKNCFNIITNEITHLSLISFSLNPPDYLPARKVENPEKNHEENNTKYAITASTLIRWAEFFDYLKERNVYDNTRIIIVSDHGAGDIKGDVRKSVFPAMAASVLVKDFNSTGEIETDATFMTNADTPYLATKDVIVNAKNPFTNSPLKVEDKFERTFIAFNDSISTRFRNEKQFDVNVYYKIRDNIFDKENWYVYKEE